MTITRDAVLEALKGVSTQSGTDLVESGVVRALNVDEGNVRFVMEIAPSDAEAYGAVKTAAETAMQGIGVEAVQIVMTGHSAPSKPAAPAGEAPPDLKPQKTAPAGPQPVPGVARILAIASGKGGVGKTTSSAAIATGLAQKGYKTCVIDFDVGLRNLDLIMGVERRVVYDFVNVIQGEASLNQALIKDKRSPNLFILPASQTRDKDALSQEGVGQVLDELQNDLDFDYIICDSPAGIEKGAFLALYYADHAIVVTNPEVSSVRDSDRILGILQSKSKKAEDGGQVSEHLL